MTLLNMTLKRMKIVSTSKNYILREYSKKGSGLKILTPNQILSRLSITLASLKAGNNSEKLEN